MTITYKNIEICVIDHDMSVLVGIKPIFNDYKVTVFAYENRFVLEPKNQELNKITINKIQKARKRMNQGQYLTEEKVRKRLNL